jgi:HK97 family phage major capsid protein
MAKANRANRDKGLSRTRQSEGASFDDASLTVSNLAFSSEEPVERWGENEVLSHDKGDYDFSRLNNSHPFMLGHNEGNPRDQQGVITKAWVDDSGIGRVNVKFSSSPEAKQIYQDMKDGIRKLISFGYDRTSVISSKKDPNGRVTVRYKWLPFHVASVPVPADPTIGTMRSHDRGKKRRCESCKGEGICTTCGQDESSEGCDACGGSGRCMDCNGNGYFTSAKSHLVDSLASADADDIAKNLSPEQKTRMKNILLKADPADGGDTAIAEAEARAKTSGITEGQNLFIERNKQIRAICGNLLKGNEDKTDKDGKRMAVKIAEFEREECDKPITGDLKTAVGDFQMRCLTELLGAQPAKLSTMESLGYDEKERNSYSLFRAFASACERQDRLPDPDTIEGDAHKRMLKAHSNLKPAGFLVPPDANFNPRTISRSELVHARRMGRDLLAGVFGQGGALVATELRLPVIDILFNEMVTPKMGITTMAGLSSNVVIPRQTAMATAYSVPETGAATLSTQVLDQISLTPKRATIWNNYSKLLLIQASPDAEAFVRRDIFRVAGLYMDEMCLNGQGAGDQPLGIMNTPGVQSMLFGGPPTFANVVLMETLIAKLNAPKEGRGYTTTSNSKGTLKSTAKLLTGATTVAAVPIWDSGDGDQDWGMMNGYRALDSQQIPNDQMIFGSWPSSIMGLFGGFDFLVNPYTGDTQALIRVTMNVFFDHVLRHPQSFCVSADSASQ